MRKFAFIVVSLFFVFFSLSAQSMIGMKKDDIVKLMKQNYPELERTKVINDTYNYLKYQDSMGEQTFLIFLSSDDICTSHKLMSHYVHLGKEIATLNAKYESAGNNFWKYTENGVNYSVELQKGQWFFSIIHKKAE
jgi:hypothetical protein